MRPGLFAFCAMVLAAMSVDAAPMMELVSTIPMPGVKGRIDHLSADIEGHRLFVAALGNDTVEVIDTRGNKHQSIGGFGEPQGVLYVAGNKRLFVANGSADRVDVIDANSLQVLKRIEGTA